MPLSAAAALDCGAAVANHVFSGQARDMLGTALATAGVNLTQLQAAVQAVDAAADTTLTVAITQAALGGNATIQQYLAGQIPSPVSGATAQQKSILVAYVILKRSGLI